MSRRQSSSLVLMMIAVVAAGGFYFWWNSPQQRAERFLADLSEAVFLEASDNALARQARSMKIKEFFSDPVRVKIAEARIDREAGLDRVAAGFLALAMGSTRLEVAFSDIGVTDASNTSMTISATVRTDSDYRKGRYTFEVPVVMTLNDTDDGLKLAVIEDEE